FFDFSPDCAAHRALADMAAKAQMSPWQPPARASATFMGDCMPSTATTTLPSSRSVDLHCHSTFSDGTLSPTALAQRAHARGVRLWALTDHDELAGLPEAQSAA